MCVPLDDFPDISLCYHSNSLIHMWYLILGRCVFWVDRLMTLHAQSNREMYPELRGPKYMTFVAWPGLSIFAAGRVSSFLYTELDVLQGSWGPQHSSTTMCLPPIHSQSALESNTAESSILLHYAYHQSEVPCFTPEAMAASSTWHVPV